MVDRHYKLLHKYLEARHDLMRLSNLTTRKSGFSSFDPKGSKTTKAVGGWLQSFVRALVSDKAVMYSGPTSTLNNAYNNNLEGAKATIQAASATRFWRNDFKAPIRGRWIALHAQLFKNNFAETIVGVWPGMVPGGVPHAPGFWSITDSIDEAKLAGDLTSGLDLEWLSDDDEDVEGSTWPASPDHKEEVTAAPAHRPVVADGRGPVAEQLAVFRPPPKKSRKRF